MWLETQEKTRGETQEQDGRWGETEASRDARVESDRRPETRGLRPGRGAGQGGRGGGKRPEGEMVAIGRQPRLGEAQPERSGAGEFGPGRRNLAANLAGRSQRPPLPALRPLVYPVNVGPDRLPGLTWPGMEKAEPQRFGEGGTIRTLARPRPEIRAPWGKSWVPRGGFARTPKVLGAFGGR